MDLMTCGGSGTNVETPSTWMYRWLQFRSLTIIDPKSKSVIYIIILFFLWGTKSWGYQNSGPCNVSQIFLGCLSQWTYAQQAPFGTPDTDFWGKRRHGVSTPPPGRRQGQKHQPVTCWQVESWGDEDEWGDNDDDDGHDDDDDDDDGTMMMTMMMWMMVMMMVWMRATLIHPRTPPQALSLKHVCFSLLGVISFKNNMVTTPS